MYYFQLLVDYIPSSEVLRKATKILFNYWGINNWLQYYATIVWLAYETDKYYQDNQKGLPIISLDKIKSNDETKLFSPSLLEYLSINEDEYIPYLDDENASKVDLNVDYRKFRSKPFVKLKDGSGYLVINNQILCERLFNSLYFDFFPYINGKKGAVDFRLQQGIYRENFISTNVLQLLTNKLRFFSRS